jgi:hypothetical protein
MAHHLGILVIGPSWSACFANTLEGGLDLDITYGV